MRVIWICYVRNVKKYEIGSKQGLKNCGILFNLVCEIKSKNSSKMEHNGK